MHPPLGPSVPLVPPLYQSSVYVFPDVDALDRVYEGGPGFVYTRDGHPNAVALAEEIARLESARWAVIGGSGMSAMSAAVLAIVQQGDRILASNRLYGRTTQLLTQELGRFGVRTELVDCNLLDQVQTALNQPTKLLIVETISNPLLRVPDLSRLVELCHARNCLLLVDNTFATPMLCRPLELGADLVLESITKMLGGHGDVTLGALCGNGDLLQRISEVVSIWGLMSSPFECWLALRGLGTLPLRMEKACANAAALADWLPTQPGVARVLYPGRSDHPDHATAKRLLQGGFGNMLCYDLQGGRAAVNRFMRSAPGIPFSPSLGDIQTTCSYPAATSHRYLDLNERTAQGIGEGLIRLSVGIEPIDQIMEAMARGLI